MKHVKQISKHVPAKAESLLVTSQKVDIFAAVVDAVGALAETIGSWIGLFEDEE